MPSAEIRKQMEQMKRKDVKQAFATAGDGIIGGSLEFLARYVVHMERTRQAVKDELDRVRLALEESKERHARWAEEAMHERELRQTVEQGLDQATAELSSALEGGIER
jgi:hypothetical protein